MRVDGGGFLKSVYNDWDFDLATGWHQYRNDPAVSTTVWYRSGQPKGAPWTNQWDWKDEASTRSSTTQRPRSIRPSARRSTGDFVRKVNTELPIWTPIEQIFVTTISAKARNQPNTPRWGSSSWHDLWLADKNRRAGRPLHGSRQHGASIMRILTLAGRRLAASIPTLLLILIGIFLLLQFAPGDTVDALMAQMGGGDAEARAGTAPLLRARPLDRRAARTAISGGWSASTSATPPSTASRSPASSPSACPRPCC